MADGERARHAARTRRRRPRRCRHQVADRSRLAVGDDVGAPDARARRAPPRRARRRARSRRCRCRSCRPAPRRRRPAPAGRRGRARRCGRRAACRRAPTRDAGGSATTGSSSMPRPERQLSAMRLRLGVVRPPAAGDRGVGARADERVAGVGDRRRRDVHEPTDAGPPGRGDDVGRAVDVDRAVLVPRADHADLGRGVDDRVAPGRGGVDGVGVAHVAEAPRSRHVAARDSRRGGAGSTRRRSPRASQCLGRARRRADSRRR